MNRIKLKTIACIALTMGLASCSVYKYVPEGGYLLNKVEVTTDDKSVPDVGRYKNLSHQTPNSRWFGLFRLPLRFYSFTGSKSGEAPVIYDELMAEATRVDMKRSLMNSGYLNADVSVSTKHGRRPKTKVRYKLEPGKMFVIDTVRIMVKDSLIDRIIQDNIKQSLLVPGMNLNADVLNDERNRIVNLVHRYGYYRFNRDYIPI